MTAYSFQFNLFPILQSMKSRARSEGLFSIVVALGLSMVIYISLSILSIYTFGSRLDEDVINNVSNEINRSSAS